MSDITLSGPLFDGGAERTMDRYVTDVQNDIATIGITRIHARLATVLRHDTGRYESKPHEERQENDVILTDTPIVYGPWLEGTGSRNAPKTRFKGYFTFRLISQTLEADAGDIAQHDLDTGGYVREMN